MERIRQIIRDRDNLSKDEIDELFDEAKDMLHEGEDPEDVLQEVFGLEPDFVFDPEFLKCFP